MPRGIAPGIASSIALVVLALAAVGSTAAADRPPPRTITTLVSSGFGDGGPATAASMSRPHDLAIAEDGDVFFTDLGYHTIRAIDAQTGTIRAIAGNGWSGDPPAVTSSPTDVPLGWPFGLVLDEDQNLIFADFTYHRIRFLNRGTTPVTRFGVTIPPGSMAAIAGDGFVGDLGEGRFSGDGGPALDASLNFPRGVVLGPDGALYLCDIDNLRVRRVDPETGVITTVAGDGSFDLGRAGDGGPATEASVRYPSSIAFGPNGSLTIAEFTGSIRRVGLDGVIRTIAGTASFDDGYGGDGGPAIDALIGQNPKSLTFDPEGNLLFADQSNGRIRRIDADTRVISTVAGPGLVNDFGISGHWAGDVDVPPVDANLGNPSGLAFRGGELLIASEIGGMLWTLDPGADGVVDADPSERIAPLATGGDFKGPLTVVADQDGLVISPRARAVLYRALPDGSVTTLAGTGFFPASIDGPGGDPRDDPGDGGPASAATVSPWMNMALAPNGDVYLADWAWRRIRRIEASPVPGGGSAVGPGSTIDTVVRLPFEPNAVAVAGDRVFFDDFLGHRIWRFDASTGRRTLVAGTGRAGSNGDGGPAIDARIRCVAAMVVDRAQRHLYVADACSGDVRVVDLETGIIDTAFDMLGNKPFDHAEPSGLAILGNRFLFVSDAFWTTVDRVDLRDPARIPVRVAGLPYTFTPGFTGDDVPALRAELGYANGIAIDPAGRLIITEEATQRVRRVGVVDILPGSFPNRIDLRSSGAIAVALLGTAGVPAAMIDPASVRVAGAAADASLGSSLVDLDGDGRLDLLVHVPIADLRLGPADVEARVVARTVDGHRIRDADWVTPIAA